MQNLSSGFRSVDSIDETTINYLVFFYRIRCKIYLPQFGELNYNAEYCNLDKFGSL